MGAAIQCNGELPRTGTASHSALLSAAAPALRPHQLSIPPPCLPRTPLQVIDVEGGLLQNVITFPPEGAFIVDSAVSTAGPQRTEFQFNAATLKLPAGRKLPLPPFGKGW